LLQTRKWLAEWSNEGVEALDIVAADALNPNAALTAPVAYAAIDASNDGDLNAWTLRRDISGRPWLLDTVGTPHIALAHHAAVFGIFDQASTLLRRISTGFGWELPACLFPILPVERRRWRHLPMLTIGNGPVVSRERWIVETKDLSDISAVNDPFERFSLWCSLVKRIGLPETVTLRATGSPNETGRTILTDSILAADAFLERNNDYPSQLVFEAGPTSRDGLVMTDGKHHATQLAISWRDHGHWRRHPPKFSAVTAFPEWRQVNLQFKTTENGPCIPWGEIDKRCSAWLADGLIRRWFFVRKPPGLRLRFEQAESSRIDEAIQQWRVDCAELLTDTDCSRVVAVRHGVYEPECERMGGVQGIELLHQILCAITPIAIGIEQAQSGSEARYPIAALGANSFIQNALLDSAEITDVWQRLNGVFEGAAALPDPATRSALTDPTGFRAGLPVEVSFLADAALQLAHLFGTEARALANCGGLAVGLRAWLVDAVLFQWNIFGLGLDLSAMAAMVSGALRYVTRAS
jgi:thiopeptide-type bacteriocin biosynthesis protein